MKKQKRSTLFRALLCSSALTGISSQVFGQEGAASTGGAPLPPADPTGGEGVAGLGRLQQQPAIPNYDLPRFQFPTNPGPWFDPPAPTRGTWQSDLGPRFRFETRIGEWLGSDDQGQAAINAMLPLSISDAVLFLDARGITTYGGGAAGSVGTGIRYFDSTHDRIWGLAGYWDYDNGNSRAYDQFGVSVESLGRWVDMRANGYFVLNRNTNILSQNLTGVVTPSGSGFSAQALRRTESAYSGFDAEIGGPLPVLGRYGFSGYVGGYYFQSDSDREVTGTSVRIQAHATDDVDLGINVTHDDVFDTSVFGTVVLTLPDGRPQTWFRPKAVENQILDRVQRRYRVMTHQQSQLVNLPTSAMMPMGAGAAAGSFVSNVIYVDPNSPVNGTGTFENPLNTFQGFAAPPANTLIFVRSGNVAGQAILPANSFLFSEAYLNSHPVTLMTSLGSLTLPTLNAAATTPVWSNPAGGTLVTITGDHTEIAGFTFDGTTTAGPYNTIVAGQNVSGLMIHDNTFRNYGEAAVDLRNITGTIANNSAAQIYSNQFYGSTGFSFNGVRLINNGIGTLDLELGQTEYNTFASTGLATGNVAYGNSGEDLNGNGTLDAGEDRNGNLTLDTGTAYSVTALNRAIINAHISGNVAGAEIDSNSDGRLNSEDINNNRVLDPGEDSNGNGVLDFGDDLNQNGRFDTGSGVGFAVVAGATQSVVNLRMTDNIADRNIGHGILLSANESTLNAGTLGEDVNGDGRLSGFEDANHNGILDPSEDLNGNGTLDAGEDTNQNGLLDAAEDLNGNTALNFGEDANEDRNGNGILDTGEDLNGDGFLSVGNRNNRLDGGNLLARNIVTRNGGDGIHLDSINNSNILLRMVGNQVGGSTTDRSTGNRGIGFNLNADGGSLVADIGYVYHEDLNLNGVLDAGEDINRNGRLDEPQAAEANQFVANQGGGLNFNLTGTATARLNIINNIIEGIGGGLMGFSATGTLGSEDINGNGILDPGEDRNGNGTLELTGAPYFDFTNDSQPGININQVNWNLAGAALEFDTSATRGGAPFAAATSLIAASSSDILTGLQTVNGTTTPFSVTDRTTALNLTFNSFNAANGILDTTNGTANTGEDFNEDTNGNGILDTGEDVSGDGYLNTGNGNGTLDTGEDIRDIFSFNIDLDPAGAALAQAVLAPQLAGSTIDVTYSTGQVAHGIVQVDPNNAAGVILVQGLDNLGSGTGIGINTADNAVLQSSTILNNRITDFGGAGISAHATGAGNIQDLVIRNNSILRNGSNDGVSGFHSGIELSTSYIPTPPIIPGTPQATLNATILLNDIQNNIGGGVAATSSGGVLNLVHLEDNTLSGNGRGVSLSSSANAVMSARITNNTITDNISTNGTSGSGLVASVNNATLTLNDLALNTISTNAGDGINLSAANNGILNVPQSEDVNGNDILDQGEDANEDANSNGVLDPGEDVNLDGVLNRGNGNGLIDRGIYNNIFTNNVGGNIVLNANHSTVDLGTVDQNVITSLVASNGGVIVDLSNGSTMNGAFTRNIITGTAAANVNVGAGILLQSSASTFDLTVGGANAADGNTISLRNGAGIAVVMTDTGSGQFVIRNNNITGIRDDLDSNTPSPTPYQGDGVSVSLVGSTMLGSATATLLKSEISDNVIGSQTNQNLGTGGSGIAVRSTEDTSIEDLLVTRNTIGNAGNDNTTVPAILPLAPDDAGIKFERLDNSRFNAVSPRPGDIRAITIADNDVQNNGTRTNGVDFTAGLFMNVQNGIRDDIDFDIRNNIFSGNTGSGIHLLTQADASLATDITANTIENNTINGILLEGNENTAADLETQGGTWTQNIIRGNLNNGIQLDSVFGDVVPLTIGQNGVDPLTGASLGNLISSNGHDGIEINGYGIVSILNNTITGNGLTADVGDDDAGLNINLIGGTGTLSVILENNAIVGNTGDGIETRVRGDRGFVRGLTMIAFGNTIDGNTGRGVDVLNQADGDRFLIGLASTSLRFGDDTLAGSNRIASNGLEGFYVVNTNAVGQTQTLANANTLLTNGTVYGIPNILLDIQRNEISGNNLQGNAEGAGLVIHVGSTNSTEFAFSGADNSGLSTFLGPAVGTNAGDPFAANGRINARITNNTFDGNLGHDVLIDSYVSTAAPVTTAGTWNATQFNVTAFESDPLSRLNLVFKGNVGDSNLVNAIILPGGYTNAEGTFKSRVNTQTPGGPFTNAGRLRSITRIPYRGTPTALAPFGPPDNGIFEYPGLGESTFRIESDFDVSGFLAPDTFLTDSTPPFLPNFGFGWGVVPVGTFDFDTPFVGLVP